MSAPACTWCGAQMPPSRQPKRFCSNAHRGLFHEACRKLAERLFTEGVVLIEQLHAIDNAPAPTLADKEAAFWDRVDMSGGPDACWPYLGPKNADGYGRTSFNGKTTGAHRIAFELATKSELGALHALHRCDNPSCCNPSHLWAGTNLENILDCRAKGRAGPNTPIDVDRVLELIAEGKNRNQVAIALGVSRTGVVKALARAEKAINASLGGGTAQPQGDDHHE